MKIVEKIKEQLISAPGTSCDKDIAMAVLMRDPENFASLFNSMHIFKEKIRPEDLVERDSRLATLRFEDMERMKKKGQTLYRDVYKTWIGRYKVHMGLENASAGDPTLAIRTLNYDATEYHTQMAAMQKENRKKWKGKKEKGLTEEEWLRKLKMTDSLELLVTAVLFTGVEWDCAKDIRDMFEIPDEYVKWKPSWPIFIVNPYEMSDEEILAMESNDMKFFMGVIKYSKDSVSMETFIKQYCNTFEISPQIAYITGVMTDMKWLEKKYAEKRNEREKGEDMCLAFEEWEKRAIAKGKTEGRAEGKAEGRTEGIIEGKVEGISEERRRIVVAKYAKGYSAMEIAELLEISLQETEDIISAIRA